jgi:hypothetical protein
VSAPDGVRAHQARTWGPALVFERLWKRQQLPELLERLRAGRRFGFDVERVVFALALQRLCAPGSDLQGSGWLRTVECEGFDRIALQHMYRTVGWLSEVRDDLEKDLFLKDRDLFSQTLDLVFIDTTSTFIYRTEETAVRKRGYSRDRMPDYPQVVICLVVDKQGWPIAWDLLPGNTADTVAFVAMIKKLRERFSIRRVVVVADRDAIARDARLDGKFVLRTSTEFDTAEVARAYKSLWRVERAFRETKSTLEVRPTFHHRDDTTIGHIVGCFLALRLEVDLQRRLDERGADVSWPDLMRDLAEVKAVDVSLDDKLYRLRTDLRGSAFDAFAAAGVRPPSALTLVRNSPAAAMEPPADEASV